ncbi:biosynthetic peptidoglycan transglycosylase [Pseudorhodoferax soli]|uniref:Transglycosylase n=1 Tax=Pseudorhodoferax soli TaxID=545864 RepID=A0A368XUG3_9BURK|nr:biosynthetic peptidoglycan transglycosylase [Pseudorhodoferax soli]RCW71611.1 transglycosylase [Pseudorhodoferax soli]
MSPARALRLLLLSLAALLLGVVLAGAVALRLLAPQPGEWAMPLRIGPWHTSASVPAALRLATAAPFATWLDGRRLQTRWGPVQLHWQAHDRSLHLQCAPCRMPASALGGTPLELQRLQVTVFRDFETMQGLVRADTGVDDGPALQAWFTGRLQGGGLALQLRLPATPIADAYAVLAPQLPELRQARIGGEIALRAQWQLPAGPLRVQPQLEGFTVQGLGTEAWAHASSSCGAPSRLRQGDWLVRAVLAAEDQRFFEHPGYDIRELQAALSANQALGGVRRGGSTLSQQLAKRLVTGDERSATRKLRELLYAVEMEQTLGKARILQLYLDNAPWGMGVCGAEAAARGYFGRSARQLEPAQAVWLAAMLHRPDAEARAWRSSGGIALERAEWVAGQLRGGTRARERRAATEALRALAQPAP